MVKRFALAIAMLVAFCAGAQQKTLTLEQSVLQQYRQFRADNLLGFQWIPATDDYSYFGEMGQQLFRASARDAKPSEVVSLATLNTATGETFRNFGTVDWRSATSFLISAGPKVYEFNVNTQKATLLFTLPEGVENVTFDPQKSKVAYTIGNNLYVFDKAQKAVTNHSNPAIVAGIAIARSEFGIKNGIFWSPSGNKLGFYEKDETDVADYPILDISTTPGTLRNIKYPMAGQTSERPRVGIYDLASDRTIYIAPSGNPDDYLTNFAFSSDEKYVTIAELNRGQNHMKLQLVDAVNGTLVRTLFEEKSNTWVEPENAAYFLPKDPNHFIWVSERDGYTNLYYYNISGKLVRQLTRNKFMLSEILGTNVSGTEIYFSATGPNPTNSLIYKVNLKGKQQLLSESQGVHHAIVSPNGNFLVDEFSTLQHPGKTAMIEANGKSRIVVESSNKYDGYALGQADFGTIKAADGITDLHTRMIKPSNFDPSKKYPVLIYVYGGPHAQMVTNSFLGGASLWMYWMAEQGYLVFTVDNRGSANRSVAFESVIHRNLGVNEVDDQLAGVRYLKSLPYVDGDRLAVHGWSYGGFMTISMLQREPALFKAGVAGGPVTDWKFYEIMYGERYMDSPAENPEGYDKTSTLNKVAKLDSKLLLIHGTADDVVVLQHNYALLQKFVEAQKQVDYFAYPMHKHNVMGRDRVHLIQKVLDYVMMHNK